MALVEIETLVAGPQPLLSLAIFRCLLGGITLLSGLDLVRNYRVWIGRNSVLPLQYWRDHQQFNTWSPIAYLRVNGDPMAVVIAMHLVLALCVMVGAGAPYTCIGLFLTTLTIHRRNPAILHGADNVGRTMLFLLMFTPCTAAMSVDRWLHAGDLGLDVVGPSGATRLLQLQMCIIYTYTVGHKLLYSSWRRGYAVYCVLNNRGMRNFPLPDFVRTPWFGRIATWVTLAIEMFLVIGLWIHDYRLIAVGLGILLHASLGYALTLRFFSWTMIAGLILFIDVPVTGAASSHIGPGHDIVLWGLIVVYAPIAVLWDIPIPQRFLFKRVLQRLTYFLGLEHGWGYFAGEHPGRAWGDLEVVIALRSGGVHEIVWSSREPNPLLGRPTARLYSFSERIARPQSHEHIYREALVEFVQKRAEQVLGGVAMIAVYRRLSEFDMDSGEVLENRELLCTQFVMPGDGS